LKDIIKFLIADKTDRDLDEIPISEVMTKHLIMAKKNTAITECEKILTTNNVSSLIIVDDDDKNNNLVGIITSTNFVNFSENCIGFAAVKDYMSIKDKVSAAAQIMSEKNISRLIVTDQDNQNKLAGIISETDLSRTVPAFMRIWNYFSIPNQSQILLNHPLLE
jgi:CBS domain-containing protein